LYIRLPLASSTLAGWLHNFIDLYIFFTRTTGPW
jgi:hypothetical protein